MRRPRTPALAALSLALGAGLALVLAAPGAAATSGPPRASAPTPRTASATHPARHRPSKVIMPVRRAHGVAGGTRTVRISYHGGRVMTGTVHLYVVWYGAWTARPTVVPLLTDLLRGFGGSPYAGTNATYTDAKKRAVSTDVRYTRSTVDSYSQGASLSDAAVRQVVIGALKAGSLPPDSNGIYLVLTSADVKETSGFGTKYCGWHTRTTFQRKAIRYLFVGDPTTQAPRGCVPPVSTTPNADRGADAMASTVVHEIDETLTDPDLDAWYDRWFSENADKCAWTYGYTYRAANGGTANVRLGGHDFLVQQNWVARATQGCALS